MFGDLTTNQLLILFIVLGAGFVIYRVFTDEKGAHRDRREEGFDIIDRY